MANLCSNPSPSSFSSLPHTQTHNKNCHGVFHQLPTRGSFLGLLPWGTQPTKPQTRAHFVWVFFFFPSVIFISLFLPPHKWMCALEWVAVDWRARVGVERGGAMIRIPQDWVEENSAGYWRRDFFFFRNLVAWFSYLSQYIFTYLLLKWIPLQLMKKNLVNMLWIYIKKIFHADAATGELALWSNRSITS